MPVLLRLFLCLTLLANTVGGAWAAQGMARMDAPVANAVGALPQTGAACHDMAGSEPVTLAGHAAAGHHLPPPAGTDPGDHCARHGCDCLQHCAWTFHLSAVPDSLLPRTGLALPAARHGQGLPRPYQPIRPPIA
ncbi:MAG TPA: CopL family metal-binding regulatory protein [Stenotrophomonas sp.]|jgi:hypothetical protein